MENFMEFQRVAFIVFLFAASAVGGAFVTTPAFSTAVRSIASKNSLPALPGCEVNLEELGGDIETTALQRRKLLPFRHALKQVHKTGEVSWNIKGIVANRPMQQPRVSQIISDLMNPQSELSQDFRAHIEALGGMQNPALWNAYFGSYDRLVAYTPGYLDLFLMANRVLPKSGRIADFGAGSGNGSSILSSAAPARRILALDLSPGGLEAAARKLKIVTGNDPSRFEVRTFDLKAEKLEAGSLDGAVMNNVLYTLGDKKAEVLKNVYASLKPGTALILNDPGNMVQQDPAKTREFVLKVASDAVKSGAPLTEYDVALVGAINIQVLMSPKSVFLTVEELRSLAQEAGFIVRGFYKGYYGASNFLVLQKP
jgi:SAM-dependent methyltransferase